MSTQVKAITLRATYEGDLSGMKQDAAAIGSFRRQLQQNPIKVPVRLDLSSIRADATKAAAEIKKTITGALSSVTLGGGTSKGGIIIPASAMKEMEAFAATSKGSFKEVRDENLKLVKSFEQLEAGLLRVTTKNKKGKMIPQYIDTRPLEDFQQKLADIERKYAGQIGSARGSKGDVAAVLRQKQQDIVAALNDPKLTAAVRNTPSYQRADRSLNRLEERIQSLTGTQADRNSKLSRGLRIDALKDGLLAIDKATSATIGSAKGNRGDVAAALMDKRRRIEAELAHFQDIANSSAYKQALKAINTLDRQIAQGVPTQDRAKANEARRDYNRRTANFIARQDDIVKRRLEKDNKGQLSDAKAISNQGTREREINRVLNEREAILQRQIDQYRQLAKFSRDRGMTESSQKYNHAANLMEGQLNQVRLDRRRESNTNLKDLNANLLKRQLDHAIAHERTQREQLKNEEAAARAIKNRAHREAELNRVLQERRSLTDRTRLEVGRIGGVARANGLTGLADRASNAAAGYERQGISDMRRLASATNTSGHAFNFHSNALLKNAATFIKWYIPAQAAMAALGGISKGLHGAIEAQRTFALLAAVFRGSKEDAKLLADETLNLAAANGRSVDEAAQASVAWARMGLTRTQILVAMETSLRAANVAEISAAEATAYLTANYKAFGQTIADIPATLDYINALSNKNAVAPKEIFEGLSRSAAIAKQAGVEFETLAGIITTVTETTQRPGAEIGNAVKTVITRLNRPSVAKDLKDQFKLDFTTAEGDAKKMTDVLAELAALYPTLNTLEKGRLKNIVAGANQGNRFAIIMDNWTESLIAQAKAGLDANSAMRENEMIMDTVSAKLQQLDTSWTRLFHTLGESGIFDALTDELNGVAIILGKIGDGISYVSQARGRVGTSGITGGIGEMLGKAIQYTSITGAIAAIGSNDRKKAPTSIITSTEAGRLSSQAIVSRNRVKALAAGDEAFRIMARQFGSQGTSNEKILSQFDEAVSVLSALPGGEANVAKARLRIRPLIASGNVEEGRRALNQTAARLYLGQQDEFKGGEQQRAKSIKIVEGAISATTNEMERLNQQIESTGPGEAQDNLKKKLYETENALKAQQDALATLQQQFKYPLPDPLAGLRENMDAYLADLEAISSAYSELATTFGSSGFAKLDGALKIGAARMQGNLLQTSLDATLRENAAMDAAGINPQDKAARDALATAMQYRLDDIRKASEEAVRKAELEMQAATLRTPYEDARRSTGSGFGRYEIGISEGDRLGNRARGIMTELRRNVQDPFLGQGNAVNDARELGAMTERMVQGKETLFSLEDRMNRAIAERANLESDITEENRKQTEEANRRLALASREDQLRTAGAAAYLRGRGQSRFGLSEFQFFSEGTRNAISSYSPRSVKGLDERERDQNERRGNLDREITGIAISLRTLRDTFNNLLPKAEERASGIMDPNNPFGAKPGTANDIITKGKEEIRMNLVTGPINIQLDFSRHVQDIKAALQVGIDAKFETLRKEFRRAMDWGAEPNTAAAAGAW